MDNMGRPHVDHRVAPIKESGEQCEADTRHVIHASGFHATLDIPRELSAKTRFSARIALAVRKNKTPSVSTSETTPTIARAKCSMRLSCQSQPAFAGGRYRRARGANYCGPQSLLARSTLSEVTLVLE
jgi:hypothetical protein